MQRIYSCLRAELVLAAHHEMSERDKEILQLLIITSQLCCIVLCYCTKSAEIPSGSKKHEFCAMEESWIVDLDLPVWHKTVFLSKFPKDKITCI